MDSICKDCKNCLQYNGNDNPPIIKAKTNYDVENGNDATEWTGMIGANCSKVGFFIMDIAECDSYEQIEKSNKEEEE